MFNRRTNVALAGNSLIVEITPNDNRNKINNF